MSTDPISDTDLTDIAAKARLGKDHQWLTTHEAALAERRALYDAGFAAGVTSVTTQPGAEPTTNDPAPSLFFGPQHDAVVTIVNTFEKMSSADRQKMSSLRTAAWWKAFAALDRIATKIHAARKRGK